MRARQQDFSRDPANNGLHGDAPQAARA